MPDSLSLSTIEENLSLNSIIKFNRSLIQINQRKKKKKPIKKKVSKGRNCPSSSRQILNISRVYRSRAIVDWNEFLFRKKKKKRRKAESSWARETLASHLSAAIGCYESIYRVRRIRSVWQADRPFSQRRWRQIPAYIHGVPRDISSPQLSRTKG